MTNIDSSIDSSSSFDFSKLVRRSIIVSAFGIFALSASSQAQDAGFLLYVDFGVFDICATTCPDGAGNSEFCCEVI